MTLQPCKLCSKLFGDPWLCALARTLKDLVFPVRFEFTFEDQGWQLGHTCVRNKCQKDNCPKAIKISQCCRISKVMLHRLWPLQQLHLHFWMFCAPQPCCAGPQFVESDKTIACSSPCKFFFLSSAHISCSLSITCLPLTSHQASLLTFQLLPLPAVCLLIN